MDETMIAGLNVRRVGHGRGRHRRLAAISAESETDASASDWRIDLRA